MIGGVLVVLAAGAAGTGVPATWKALDLRLRVTLSGVEEHSSRAAYYNIGVVHWEPRLGLDPWGNPFTSPPTPSESFGKILASPRDYSCGPNGVFEEGRGDDVLLLGAEDPRLSLFRESAALSALSGFGLGTLLLVLLQRRGIGRLSRAALPGLGAIGAGGLAFGVIRALELVAPRALPPYPLPLLLATAVLGGAIGGQALAPASGESTAAGPPPSW